MPIDRELIVDTNILLRCSLGRAMTLVRTLVIEMYRVLVKRFALTAMEAKAEVDQVLSSFEILAMDTYQHLHVEAVSRLRQGGAPDWPALAAAISRGRGVWTQDVDFFGTGVATWTSATVLRFLSSHQD